jgi:rhodanese-related sulfurtransferase
MRLQLQNHVISIDEMADALINNDPEYQLIDLRSAAAYRQYQHLPGVHQYPVSTAFLIPGMGSPMSTR